MELINAVEAFEEGVVGDEVRLVSMAGHLAEEVEGLNGHGVEVRPWMRVLKVQASEQTTGAQSSISSNRELAVQVRLWPCRGGL